MKHESSFWKDVWQKVNEISIRDTELLASGLAAYNSSRVITPQYNGEVVWSQNSTKLYKYAAKSKSATPILFIPSLINKPYILDISIDKSLMLNLAKLGLAPYLLDWGEPGDIEGKFTIEDYINKRMLKAIQYIKKVEKKAVVLSGYCMGGFFSLAAAVLKEDLVSKLITIATPWDFHVSEFPKINYQTFSKYLNSFQGNIPNWFVNFMFYMQSSFDINKKFINFALGRYDKKEFLSIEHWVNDGVNIAKPVLKECLMNFMEDNILYEGSWLVNGRNIAAANVNIPALCVIASNDSISPYSSTLPLHKQLKNSQLLEVASGHIGMIINDKYNLAEKIAAWVKGKGVDK